MEENLASVIEDREVPLSESKGNESVSEDFNLSQLQIKDQSFDGNLEAQLDKKVTSAKKEFFELSESDRDLKQFEETKEPDNEEIPSQQLIEKFQLNNDSVPGK